MLMMDFSGFPVLNPTFNSTVDENNLFSENTSVFNTPDPENCPIYEETNLHNSSHYLVVEENSPPNPENNINANESSVCNWILVSERDSLDIDHAKFGSVPTVAYSHKDLMVEELCNEKTTKSTSTMTDPETSDDLCESDFANGPNVTSKYHTKHSFTYPVEEEGCSIIHLQRQGSAMAEYLARVQLTSLPLGIQQFLTKINLNNEQIHENEHPEKTTTSLLKDENSVITSNLNNHSEFYSYPECQVSPSNEEHLQAHMTVDSSERRFKCNICGACLKRKEHLDQHKHKHSEERPYVCNVCCKGFKRNEHLRRHSIIHSGNKFFTCSECGKSFSRKDHLNKHAQTHTLKQFKINSNKTFLV